MPDLTDTAVRLYRRLFGDQAALYDADEIPGLVLDGNNAVAISEAGIVENAVFAGSLSASTLDTAWRSELHRAVSNEYGGVLSARGVEGPRGAIASAIGLALTGRRTTAFLSGQDMASVHDLLVNAAGRHLPLVIHLTNQSLAAHGGVKGSGHEAFHMSTDSGCFTLFACNVQEAVDFTFIARRVAEQSLIPGVVVMDEEQTAGAIQDVKLLSPAQVRRFLGPPAEKIQAPSDAQKLLFGESRRRVPVWHDLDRPVLQGALFGAESFALGALANQPFFSDDLDAAFTEALSQFKRVTGRQHERTRSHNLKHAKLVLVAQGSAVETAIVAADYMAREHKTQVGVLGINCLRPFPAQDIVQQLRGKQSVAVLERLDTPLAGDPPLLREIRAGLDRALEAQVSAKNSASNSGLSVNELPQLHSVIYGMGGLPLRVADLSALPEHLSRADVRRTALGVNFHNPENTYPKRQVLLDALQRAYPDMQNSGLRSREKLTGLLPADAFCISVYRLSGQGYESLCLEASAMLYQIQEGSVRSRVGVGWQRWSSRCVDRIAYAENSLLDPGDECPLNMAVIAVESLPSMPTQAQLKVTENLVEGGTLLIAGVPRDADLWGSLSPVLRQQIKSLQLRVFCSSPLASADGSTATSADELNQEYLLGGFMKTLLEVRLLDEKQRKIFSARENILHNLAVEKRDTLLNVFLQGFENVWEFDCSRVTAGEEICSGAPDEQAPIAVQHLIRNDDNYDSLPRFWDQVGVLYRDGNEEQLTVDPFLATGTVAPLSSTFRNFSDSRTFIPEFNSSRCTGCGNCWTVCPDSAIGTVAISPANLIDMGIRLTGGTALRQISSQLSTRIVSQNKGNDDPLPTAGEMLKEAYAWLGDKMTLAEDRKQAVSEAMDGLNETIGRLAVAVTKPFFHDAEAVKKDSAELLSLVINPNSCKGCGLCVQVCEPDALNLVVQTEATVAEAQDLWNIWAQTPDTPAETIERIFDDPEMSSMAATLLSRYCMLAMAGGDGAEAGSGEKIGMRLILATAEFRQQPVANLFAKEVRRMGDAITQLIKDRLSSVLPVEDIEKLERGLNNIQTPRIDLATFADKMESDLDTHSVDTSALRRMINLSRDLTDLHWRLTNGLNGLGRARFGLALGPGSVAAWAGSFPNNAFQVPVVVDMTGDTAQIAAGLLEGQIRETCEIVGLIRKAELEIDNPAGAEFIRSTLNRLTWQDLTEEEKQLCPPLFLVGSDDLLSGRGLSQVVWLLNSDLPIKILVMSELGFGLTAGQPMQTSMVPLQNPSANLGMLAMAQRHAYVAQVSISEPDHLQSSVTEAIKFTGPALINVNAPSPERHGFKQNQTLRQAHLAVTSRAFPLFRYNPASAGVFGTRISLQGNQDLLETWTKTAAGQYLTPAHWASAESRFKPWFSMLADDAPTPTEMLEWMDLNERSRKGKTPYIEVSTENEAEDAIRYCVDPGFIHVVEEQRQSWQTLQELAGLVTPFTDRVEQEVQEKLEAAHQTELDALKKDYEQRIIEMQQNMKVDMSGHVRDQLVNLMNLRPRRNTDNESAENQ
ncbi:MAG: 4Fe-4S binding protein [Gammaproteobacteria bacterium]|nr:4Fe-4S binding protein [Gammaproteobacteria bacterium]